MQRNDNEIKVAIIGDHKFVDLYKAIVNATTGGYGPEEYRREVVVDGQGYNVLLTIEDGSRKIGQVIGKEVADKLASMDIILYTDHVYIDNKHPKALEVMVVHKHYELSLPINREYNQIIRDTIITGSQRIPKKLIATLELDNSEKIALLLQLCIKEMMHRNNSAKHSPPFWPESITRSDQFTRVRLFQMLEHYIKNEIIKPMNQGFHIFPTSEKSNKISQSLENAKSAGAGIDSCLDYKSEDSMSLREALNIQRGISKEKAESLQKVETKIEALKVIEQEDKKNTSKKRMSP